MKGGREGEMKERREGGRVIFKNLFLGLLFFEAIRDENLPLLQILFNEFFNII